jgi:hypothetical protein
MLKALEVNAKINKDHQLELDTPLPDNLPEHVRVIVLFNAEDEISDSEWLAAAARSSAFDFLNDPAEDIYSLEDGTPFDAQI